MRKMKKMFVGACILSMLMTGCGANTAEESNVETNIDTLVTGGVAEASEDAQNGEDNFAQRNPEGQYQGKITAIDGNSVTIALAQMPERGEMPEGEMPAGGEKPEGETAKGGQKPESKMPIGEIPTGEMPTGEMPEGQMPTEGLKPEGEMPTGNEKTEGTEPDDRKNGNGERPDGMQRGDMSRMELTLTGETMTIEITDDTTIMVNGEEASLNELTVDAAVIIVMDGDTVQSIMVMGE